jgi:hypothetical protein
MAEIRNVSKKRKIDELDAGKQAPSNKKIKIVNNTHDKVRILLTIYLIIY